MITEGRIRDGRITDSTVYRRDDGGQGVQITRRGSQQRPGLTVVGGQGHRRSGSLGVERRGEKYGGDPRASVNSYRSTRERVVVVDANGTRREYNR